MADAFLSLVTLAVFLAMFLAYFYLYNRMKKAKEKAYSELAPFFSEHGFAKPPQPKLSPLEEWLARGLGVGSGTPFAGDYRGRRFEVSFFVPRGLVQSIAVLIKTPNRTGKTISFRLYEKERMEENSLSQIHKRLEALGLYGVLWRDSGFGQWILFGVYRDKVTYILPGTLLTRANFIESLDIICDTLDLLGV